MTSRLRKVLMNWGNTNNNELRVRDLAREINRSTAQLRQKGDEYVQDVVLQDFTGKGDITLLRG